MIAAMALLYSVSVCYWHKDSLSWQLEGLASWLGGAQLPQLIIVI